MLKCDVYLIELEKFHKSRVESDMNDRKVRKTNLIIQADQTLYPLKNDPTCSKSYVVLKSTIYSAIGEDCTSSASQLTRRNPSQIDLRLSSSSLKYVCNYICVDEYVSRHVFMYVCVSTCDCVCLYYVVRIDNKKVLSSRKHLCSSASEFCSVTGLVLYPT